MNDNDSVSNVNPSGGPTYADLGEEDPAVQAAIEYGSLGLPVVFCWFRKTKPCDKRYYHKASCNPAVIRAMKRDRPRSNVAIVTGKGLLVVDIDVHREEENGFTSWEAFVAGRELPPTALARSGGGGAHLLFRVDRNFSPKRLWLPGVEFFCGKHFILVEPSVHKVTGEAYRWITHPREGIADAPPWLIEGLTADGGGLERAGEVPRPPTDLDDPSRASSSPSLLPLGDRQLFDLVVRRYPVKGPHQRNDAMYPAVACLANRGCSAEQLYRVMARWTEHFHEKGLIRSLAEALDDLKRSIRSTLNKASFQSSVRRDYRAERRVIELRKEQVAMIRHGSVSDIPGAGGSKSRIALTAPPSASPLCPTPDDEVFVSAIVVYFTHKVWTLRESPPKATVSDLLDLIEDRTGRRLSRSKLWRLKRRYITRPGKPATRCELLVQTTTGYPCEPSEFRITGLQVLLDAGMPAIRKGA